MLLVADAKLMSETRVGLGQLDSRGVDPEPLEIVEFAHGLIEDVNDDVGEVHQHPLAPRDALDGVRPHALAAEIFLDALSDALDLAVGAAGADDEIIGDGGELAHAEQDKIVSLSVQREA